LANAGFLQEIIARLKTKGIRTSLFVDTRPEMITGAADLGTDRVELYTEPYAAQYAKDPAAALAPFAAAARKATDAGLGLNAGHDLNLDNLHYFCQHIDHLDEVSIGHALVADALYYGLENTIQMYKGRIS
jgi:pyridoxine 5-phosphate synthase